MDAIRLVLHEAGYRCANPACRHILTIDIHHLEYVAEGGTNEPENLLPLCPNCHGLHHSGIIPRESIRTWKMILLSLNEGFDRKSINLLLAFDTLDKRKTPPYDMLYVSGDGVLECAALISAGFIQCTLDSLPNTYSVRLTDRAKLFIEAWKRGDQQAAVTQDIPGVISGNGT